METIHRAELKNAPYNPRYITERNRAKLKESLARVGLVQPLVWNRRSGNLVGGHQRLAQLDRLEGSRDYQLTVAVVDVDEVRERELNILLNNPEVCGEFDYDKLKTVLDTEGLNLDHTGFDWAEFMKLFGEAPSQPDKEHQDQLARQLNHVLEAYEKLTKASSVKDDTDFYCVVVFGCYEDRKVLLDALGFEDNRYIDGRSLTRLFLDLKQAHPAGHGSETKGTGIGQDPANGAGKPG